MTDYKDKEWLLKKYHGDGLSMSDIADISGVGLSTIQYWMDKFGISRRPAVPPSTDSKCADEEWLREKYIDEGLSSREIAEEAGVVFSTVLKYIHKYDIEARPKGRHRNNQMAVRTQRNGGYEHVQHREPDGSVVKVKIHRLCAVAWFGFDAVCDMDVHHSDPEGLDRPGIPWDNREGVIQPMTHSDHSKLHAPDSVPIEKSNG